MQHLQALCERYVAKCLNASTVIPVLAKSLDAQYGPLQQACYEYLAKEKPTVADPSFSTQIVDALRNSTALATAFSAVAGHVPPTTIATAATEIPSSRLPDAMASLWRRTAHAMDQDNDDGHSNLSLIHI